MFKIYIKGQGQRTKEPEDDVYYIIAKNGTFLRKRNTWVDAVVPVKQIATLQAQETRATLLLPPVSNIVLAKAIAFFEAIYKRSFTEAAVLLHYSPEQHNWELTVPEQTATTAHVSYKMDERLDGYLCAGTMHSHGRMPAFHSGTDQYDEAEWDGIHITIGDIHKNQLFSMEAEVVVNGSRFKLGLEHLDGVSMEEKKLPLTMPVANIASYYMPNYISKTYHQIERSILGDWVVPEEWMKKVEIKTYSKVYPPVTPAFSYDKDVFTGEIDALTEWNKHGGGY
jgi:PRTRC genetic system protein A